VKKACSLELELELELELDGDRYRERLPPPKERQTGREEPLPEEGLFHSVHRLARGPRW
jgi:hypothetical protein